MRKQFPGYYRPKHEDCALRFKEATFVFDTNGLLNLYRYTPESRNNLLKVLSAIKDRVWMPHQVAYEYHDNRVGVIITQREMYSALKNGVDEAIKALDKQRRSANFHVTSLIEPIRKALDEVKVDLDKKSAEHPDLLMSDPILDALTELFDGKVGEPYSAEEYKKKVALAKQRFEAKTPPGFLDSTGRKKKEGDKKYGDVLVWLQLLDFAKTSGTPLVLVTDETGEDWWQKGGGRTIGPRPELLQEMYTEATGKWFYMYSMDQFLEYSKDLLELEVKPEVIREAKEIKEENEATEQLMRAVDSATAREVGLVTSDILANAAEVTRLESGGVTEVLEGIRSNVGLSRALRYPNVFSEVNEALLKEEREFQKAMSPLTDALREQQRTFQSVMSPILEQQRTLQSVMSPITESLSAQFLLHDSLTRPAREALAAQCRLHEHLFRPVSEALVAQRQLRESLFRPVSEALRAQYRLHDSITRPFSELTANLSALGALTDPFRSHRVAGLGQVPQARSAGLEAQDHKGLEQQANEASEKESPSSPVSEGTGDSPTVESEQQK